MEDRGGRIELLLPYATLEPIRKMLLQQFMGEKFGRDNIWEGHLATELWTTQLDVAPCSTSSSAAAAGADAEDRRHPDAQRHARHLVSCAPAIPLTIGRMGRHHHIAVRVAKTLRRPSTTFPMFENTGEPSKRYGGTVSTLP